MLYSTPTKHDGHAVLFAVAELLVVILTLHQRNVFGCFAPVDYILLKNSDILQSVCELKCYARECN